MPFRTIWHDWLTFGPIGLLGYALWTVVTGRGPSWARAYWLSVVAATVLAGLCILVIGVVTMGWP